MPAKSLSIRKTEVETSRNVPKISRVSLFGQIDQSERSRLTIAVRWSARNVALVRGERA